MRLALPKELSRHEKRAVQAIAGGCVRQTEFSGGAYQVSIRDEKSGELHWVFLNLAVSDPFADAICTCEKANCVHLATAYLSLFGSNQEPIHQRFENSPWNYLAHLFFKKFGDNPNGLCRKNGRRILRSSSGKELFNLHPRSEKMTAFCDHLFLEGWGSFEEAPTPEQVDTYPLSRWCELAKEIFFISEQGDYQVSFRYSKTSLPNWLEISSNELDVGFYVPEAYLPSLVPSLAYIASPLQVFASTEGEVTKIVYHKTERILEVISSPPAQKKRKSPLPSLEHGIRVGEWVFIQDVGFYPAETHELLKNPSVSLENIPHALSEHARLIASKLVRCQIYEDPVTLQYSLEFDARWNLYLRAHLFEPGDLISGDSWLVENWAYIDEDGFYPVDGNLFEDAEVMIPFHQVGQFVTQHHAWLSDQKGFIPHSTPLDAQLLYEVSKERVLSFHKKIINNLTDAQQQDFGRWLYVEAHGFYSKSVAANPHAIRANLKIRPEQIPLLLRMHQEELSKIPGFFLSESPVREVKLQITLRNSNAIFIEPHYLLAEQFSGSKIEIFDDFIYVRGRGFYHLPEEQQLPEKFRTPLCVEGDELQFFISYELNALKPYIREISPELTEPVSLQLVTDFIAQPEGDTSGWYLAKLHYRSPSGKIAATLLYKTLKEHMPFLFSPIGLIDLKSEAFLWLKKLSSDQVDMQEETIRFNALELMRLHAMHHLALVESSSPADDERSRATFAKLLELASPDIPHTEGLASHLRPYQVVGVRWLWFLYRELLSGLLCDEMGLGKTHQAMALITAVQYFAHKHAKTKQCYFLVVCPTSVIYHWEEKIRAYLPHMRLYTYFGPKRSLEQFFKNHEILLTSYGTLRNDISHLSHIHFEVAVLDEIQIAKNHYSRVHAAIREIHAKMKLGLTGTPIENHLRELKSLMDLILPSYMPSENEYREMFVRPIEKGVDTRRTALLHRLIHPFVLRRKKQDVLKDLPEKTEEVSTCQLTAEQYHLYSELLMQRRQQLLDELRNEHSSIPYLHIFSLLSSLKQICDHPAVFLKTPAEYRSHSSGKWDLFIELMRQARESGQKVVVFSQYLMMLDVIELFLKEEGIGFASLRGTTQNRQAQIKKFNEDPKCEVFVGSLHVAAWGIDLTAGSIVIHYDRWWNAARENQATDRVHRSGQKRAVSVFKLVTEKTFEQKIDEMIRRKGSLMEDIVGVDDQHLIKKFSRQELIELLQLVQEEEGGFDTPPDLE